MAQNVETNHPAPRPDSAASSIEHMEEEFRALEGARTRWWLWLGGILLLAAGAAAYYGFADRTPVRPTRAVATTGVVIELAEPRPGKLEQPPTHFAWESISGRHDYHFVLSVEGETVPLVDRAVTNTSLELKPEELALLTPGRSYAWSITARQRDRRILAAGQSRFQIR
jgi:hypothetical protein